MAGYSLVVLSYSKIFVNNFCTTVTCMHRCVWACMRLRMHVCMHAFMCLHASVYACTCTKLHTNAHIQYL